MILKGQNILIISPEPWSDMFVSKHHYAKALCDRGNQVYFLNPPTNKAGAKAIETGLYIVDYKPRFRGIHRLPGFITSRLVKWEIARIEQICQVSFTVIWQFDPSRLFNLTRLRAVRICHIVDWNQKFQRKQLAASADICLSTSSYIKEELAKYNARSFFIHHGFHKPVKHSHSVVNTNDEIRVGYIGNLNIRYLDWDLIRQLVERHPEITFSFVGPMDAAASARPQQQVIEAPNTEFPGLVPALELPTLLQRFDILILTYLADEYPVQLANPHKMMQYLGSGKVLVATYTKEFEQYDDLIVMSRSREDYLKLFDQVKQDIATYNHPDLMKRRREFAMDHVYPKQVQRIQDYLSSLSG